MGAEFSAGDGSRAARPSVSVVIPTLNEVHNLARVFAAIPADVLEVVVVDGRSTDGTVAEARRLRPDVVVVDQTGRGKGNALACGFDVCQGDIIVMIDADCSTDPGEIPAFVAALRAGADYAKGSRFVLGGGSSDITHLRRHGNTLLNGLVNLLYGTRYTDLCYGYNAIWARHRPVLDLDPGPRADPDRMLWGDGFEIETLINIRVARAGLAITEVPSYESERAFGVSNLNAVTDGLRVLRTVITEFRRRQITSDPLPSPPPAPLLPPPVIVDEKHRRSATARVLRPEPDPSRPVDARPVVAQPPVLWVD